jgi:hypothetical protein
VVAADEADGDAVRLGGGGELGGALEQEALGDVVGVVVDEGLFDEHVEIVEGDADGAALQGFLGEVGGDLAGDVGHEALVLLVKDVLLALGLEETLARALPTVSATSFRSKRSSPCGQRTCTCWAAGLLRRARMSRQL